ncbi:MAG: lipopolysaccharide heptosyltransferase I [Rhodocyclaceae bacterium]|nr:lipopolysaccharide heptosyltransferase I [Rhodocyclaceae bacterium]
MRILLVKTSSLGDVVHALPVASDIRCQFPHAVIDWVVEEPFADLVRLHAAVATVIPVAVRRWRRALGQAATWREIAAYRRAVRQPLGAEFGYDYVIDCQGLVKSALLAACARGKKYGFADPREGLAALAYDAAVDVPRTAHAVTRNRLLAAGVLGYEIAAHEPDYGLSVPPWRGGWLPKGDYAVFLTFTSRAEKEWQDAHWIALAKTLHEREMNCVLLGGSRAELERAQRLATHLPRATVAPWMPLGEVARLLAGARLAIGVDTGLTHLAAALGRPTVAIFCASNPESTGVFAATPYHNLGAAGAAPSVAEVAAAVDALLAAR